MGFEDKLFYHVIDRKTKADHFCTFPFTYQGDKIGVAAITLHMKDIDKQMTYLYRQCLLSPYSLSLFHISGSPCFSRK